MSLVVYIDDEPALCRVFEMLVGPMGIPFRTFTNPEEAVAFIASHGIAVVLCDLRMPKMSGAQVLDQIDPSIPFYMVTGDLDTTQWEEDPRVSGVLSKPYRPETLLDVVLRHKTVPSTRIRTPMGG